MIRKLVKLAKAGVALLEDRAAQGPVFTYCVVRQDMSLAQQFCQGVHAALLAGKDLSQNPHWNLALIGVPDLAALREVTVRLSANRVQFRAFFEEDERFMTALCTEAISDRRIRDTLKDLPWWTPIEFGDTSTYWRPTV